MRIIDCAQRSDEWRKWRAGRVTASRACDVLAAIKNGEAAARRDYRFQLVSERLTGQPQDDTYINSEMQHGIDTEPYARLAYEGRYGVIVNEVGLCVPDDELMVAASPDGLIDDEGCLEIKCPKTATHIAWLSAGIVPAKHVPQMQMQMWVAGRQWCEFVSFDPRLPQHLQLFVTRLPRDPVYLTSLELAIRLFLSEVEQEIAQLERFAA